MAKKFSLKIDQTKLMPVLRFLIKFNIFVIPLYFILVTDWTFPWLQTATASISNSLLTLAGFNPTLDNLLITIPIKNGNWAAYINWDCTGWKSILAFFALVMSTDFPLSKKLTGLMLIPTIYVLNIVRIFFMFFFVRTFDLQYYTLVHSIVWSWGLILAVLVLWILWMSDTKIDFFSFTLKCPSCTCAPCVCSPSKRKNHLKHLHKHVANLKKKLEIPGKKQYIVRKRK